MYYYPVFLNIVNKKCVVIGGGNVAERRVKELIRCGARVCVYAEKISREITNPRKRIKIYKSYSPAILKGATLLFIATDDHRFNQRVLEDAKREKLLVNVSDDPLNCMFIVPSIIRKGDFTIAITTGGKAPALSKAIRKVLEEQFGNEFILLMKGIEALRIKVRKRLNKSADRIKIFKESRLEKFLKNIMGKEKREEYIKNYLKQEERRIEKILGSKK